MLGDHTPGLQFLRILNDGKLGVEGRIKEEQVRN